MPMVRSPDIVVIGGSAGGIEALGPILGAFPADLDAGVIVVLHLLRDHPSALAAIFGRKCALPTVEAKDKMPIAPGVLAFAPPDHHLLVEKSGTLALSVDAPVHFSRPSIDVLFASAAEAYGPRASGVLLSGASVDGAAGLLAIRRAGGITIVQDPATARAKVMPEAAIRAGAAQQVLPPERITEALLRARRERGASA